MKVIQDHYDEKYFNDFQKEIGEFTAEASVFVFQPFIKDTDTVLDFGCGGGFILKKINCRMKIGIELNPTAREFCKSSGVPCFGNIDEIEDGVVDVAISNHCLEHIPSPYDILGKIFTKMKSGGRIVIVVPTDNYTKKWEPNDINYHLYSFSPMNLGNLLDAVGFINIKVAPLFHKCPTRFRKLQRRIGWSAFNLLCKFWGIMDKRDVQIKAIAVKP